MTADVGDVSLSPTKNVRKVPYNIVQDGKACGIENGSTVIVERIVNVVGLVSGEMSILEIVARATSFVPQPLDWPYP